MNNIIFINKENNCYYLTYNNLKSKCFIGKKGLTQNKKEGDQKTPIGEFSIGIVFGTHNREELHLDKSINYIKINKNHHWIDDINSPYYNRLVDISKDKIKFNSSEHLIEMKEQYEYAIEVKTNPQNIPGLGSAIFIHCATKKYTAGCISISKNDIKKVLSMINKNTKIIVSE